LRWAALASLLGVTAGACASGGGVPAICNAKIGRLWHGRVPNARADEYDRYIAEAITKFRTIPGNLGYQLMRETVGEETHFSVISYWTARDAIHGYAGEDIGKVRPLPRDPEFLIDAEPFVRNYDLRVLNVDCPGRH
jgi:quinol monooxygenase YgiN